MKIVINECFGGFGLSERARALYASRKGLDACPADYDLERNDPVLCDVVAELGADASGFCGTPVVIEIPDGVEWEIEEYDGHEWVSERHRTWGKG